MVEVGTIDGVQIVIDRDKSRDATPKAHALQGEHILLLTINLADIVFQAVLFLLVLHHLGILGFSFGTVQAADVQRVKNLLLHVEGHISVLHGLQCLIDKGQQEGHNDNQYRTIYYNVRVGVCIQFHFVPPLFKRFEMLRSTIKWSIIGAIMFPKKMASIIPSG